jgi:antibiotic biosynthesis monooxygenase (ABM) superfamily enzyme
MKRRLIDALPLAAIALILTLIIPKVLQYLSVKLL